MSVLNNKFKRDLWASKGMLFAIIAIITVGVSCLVGMLSTCNNLTIAKQEYYSKCRMADFWIRVKKAPLTSLETLANIKGVSEIFASITFPVIVDLKGVDKPLSGQILSLPDKPCPIVNNIVLRTGSYFSTLRREEVIVSEKFAKARKIEPGSFIHLVLNGQRKKLFVVGTAISSEFMYLTPPGSIAPDPDGYGIFWIKESYAKDVFDFHGACNSIVGLFTDQARKNPKPVIEKLSEKLGPYGVFNETLLKNQFSNLALGAEMDGLMQMATLLPATFLIVAAMVLNIVMLRMVEQQRSIIGTLKALGIFNKSILIHFLQFGLFIGFAGGLLGCLAGYYLAHDMTQMYEMFFTFPELNNHFFIELMCTGFGISIFFAILGTIQGVKKVIKLMPAESMRPTPPKSYGKILLEKYRYFWNKLDFRWQIIFRNTFRNKIHSAITIIIAMLGGSIVLTSLGMADSTHYMLLSQFEKVLLSDYDIALRDEVDNGALNEVKQLPGVYYAEPQLKVACTFYKGHRYKKAVIKGILTNSRLTVPRNERGEAVKSPPSGLLMSKRLAENFKISIGDTIAFVPIKGVRVKHKAKVVNFIKSTFGLPVYANYNYLNRLVNESNAVSLIQIKANQSSKEQKEFFKRVKQFPKLSSLNIIDQQKTEIERDFVAKLSRMAYILIFFAAIIFFGSILNSTLISIAQRQREIATFRALGYNSLEIGIIFLREIVSLNMIGAFLGLPLGYWMLYNISLQFQNDSYSMPCFVKTSSWFLTIILAFVFIVVAYAIIQYVINKMDWHVALKIKE